MFLIHNARVCRGGLHWGMSTNSPEDLQGMQDVANVVKDALAVMTNAVEVGVTGRELNALCAQVFAKHGAVSAPLLTYGAPVHAFISVNDVVVHGLPDERKLQANDVVKIDVTPMLNGYVADAARTVVVPPASKKATRLVRCVEAAFWAAMRVAKAGKPVNVIGRAVENEAKKYGFSVIHELAGHGVGRSIHEKPDVPNFYEPHDRQMLTKNLVLAVEPMITAGHRSIKELDDGWSIASQDGSLTAHYENTIIIQNGKPTVLTA